ncbi:unnamed protein product [Brassica rapa]|uniref:Aldehyde oxidase/xanthine dehydrogenase second molybdopterin binding domain-containing protein n=1 Tax=Brassica campestris TaxID=3711 RepID=A0A8D9D3T4_BRACM|nr:unnamed protein product [Brassica rapa]
MNSPPFHKHCNNRCARHGESKSNHKKSGGPSSWKNLISQVYLFFKPHCFLIELLDFHYCYYNVQTQAYVQIEGAFVQGLGFFMLEEYITDSEGLLLTGSTWTYKIPTVDTIPRQFDVEILNSGRHEKRIEGAFVQGLGFFMLEEYITDSEGLLLTDSTWTYKIPTVDTIPRQFNVEILNSGRHEKCVLSSKASGEPPLLLAASVHCATREAVKEAQRQLRMWKGVNDSELMFQLPVPATMPVVTELCGLDIVESYLEWKSSVN